MPKTSNLSSRKPRTTFRKLIAPGKHRSLFAGLVVLVIFGFLTLAIGSSGNAQRNPESAVKTPDVERETQIVSGQGNQTGPQDADLARTFRDYELVKLDARATAAKVRQTGKLSLSTRKGTFDLYLEPYDLRAPSYTAQVVSANGVALKLPKTPAFTYKGIVGGSPRAQVRMTVTENSIEGVILTEGERYFLQPARSLSKNAKQDEFVFYKGSDVTGEAGACGVTLADEVAERATSELRGEEKIAALDSIVPGLSPLKIVRLATDADAEYVAALGGASQANSQIISIMNLVDGIYQAEIGVTFQIVFQNTWSNQTTDPYSSTAPSTLLAQFRNHWNANFTHVSRSLTHLWTGKDLDEGVIGVATIAAVCRNPQSAYGLSQRFPFSPTNPITAQTVVLTAHEFGHNFSAFHTDDSDNFNADVEQPCDKMIMEAFIGNGSSFCPFSRSAIIGHANAYSSCLLESSIPAPTSSCAETPIASNVDTTGTLSPSDCTAPSRGVRYFADRYSFNATAGQQVIITINRTSGDFNPYLYLIGPSGFVIYQTDGGSQATARIPFFDELTLPLTGKYILEATSSVTQQTGDYTVKVAFNGCTLSANATQSFPASGGIGTINITPSPTCFSYDLTRYPHLFSSQWILLHEGGGSGPRSINFTVEPNPNAAGRTAFLLVDPTSPNSSFGGIKIPITQSGTGPDCVLTPIASSQTGDLSTNDCQSPIRGNGFYTDRYVFHVLAGQKVAITLSSSNAPATDTFLTLLGPNGVQVMTDDDSGGLTNSRIPGGTGMLTLGLPGTYIIEVSTFESGGTGPYSLNFAIGGPTSTLQFNQSTYAVPEGSERANLTVTRSGDTSGSATVGYETSDSAGLTNCNVFNGVASSRCDYASSVGTVNFAAGEASKSFSIPIVDDSFAEGSESFTITLTNPTGSSLGSQVSTTVTINDNDASTGPNPITQTAFFVRQHYIDFLGREPDPGGFQGWQDIIGNCPAGNTTCDRVHVSGAFFQSPEFQQRGYFVYRFYPVAFGRKPDYAEFIPDLARVSGFLTDAQLEAARVAFVDDFMNRSAFITDYNSLDNTQYVDRLLTRADVTHPSRADWITALGNGTKTRAQVLRELAESTEVYNKYYNQAFVVMQYFGYLRRDPDAAYLDWIQELDNTGNARNMINGFVNSPEYTFRFGP